MTHHTLKNECIFQNVHWPIYNFIKRYSIVSFRRAGAWIRKFYSIVGPKITNMKISIFSKSKLFRAMDPKIVLLHMVR